MPLKKVSGNMYDWCTHTHSHLGGECPHKCSYCYVQRNPHGVHPRYRGEPRLIESELKVNYRTGKIIFIEHMNDLFAEGIKDEWIERIIDHWLEYPKNQYVLQSKNPIRAYNFLRDYKRIIPTYNLLFGTTIETNRGTPTNAPSPHERYEAMLRFKEIIHKTFITIEPIMDFDVNILSDWIIEIKPEFVNIGADSKGCHLSEPPKEKILELIKILDENNIVIKKKSNLWRLLR